MVVDVAHVLGYVPEHRAALFKSFEGHQVSSYPYVLAVLERFGFLFWFHFIKVKAQTVISASTNSIRTAITKQPINAKS